MTLSWWYLLFLLIPMAMITVIAIASGWRPSRLSMPSLPSLSMPSMNVEWKKWLAAGILIILGCWQANQVPSDTTFVIAIVGLILATMWWKQVFKFIGVSLAIALLVTMVSCFRSCCHGTASVYQQYMIEMKEAAKEKSSRFPASGMSIATRTDPARCYMNPGKSHWRTPQPVKFVLAKDPKVYYAENPTGGKNDLTIWWHMPTGNYLVYPLGDAPVEVRWWQ